MRRFPILLNKMQRAAYDCPGTVPWDLVEPHEKRALANHGQSLERLAERGGLDPVELVAVLEDRRLWDMRDMLISDAVKKVKKHEEAVLSQTTLPGAGAAVGDG